jgi:hypothetical protein
MYFLIVLDIVTSRSRYWNLIRAILLHNLEGGKERERERERERLELTSTFYTVIFLF